MMGRTVGDLRSRASSGSRYGYIAILTLAFLLIAGLVPASSPGKITRGYLDLSRPPSTEGVFRLDGDWAFFPERLLMPEDFEGPVAPSPVSFARVPSTWIRARAGGGSMPSVGDATYRLVVRHAWKGLEVGLKLMRINSAFELYVDGSLIARGGALPDAPGGFVAGYAPQSAYFTPSSGLSTLVLRISNRIPGAWSGPVDRIVMGRRKAVEAETNGSVVADAFNVSGHLIFVILFIALFALTGSRLALVFSATNFLMAIRISLAREMIFLRIFPSLDYNALVRIYILSSVLNIIGVLWSLEAYLRDEGSPSGGPSGGTRRTADEGLRTRNWIAAALGATGLVSILYFALAPDSAYQRFFVPLLALPFACYVYYIWEVISYVIRRRIGVGVAGIYLLFFYCMTFEILCQMRVIDQECMHPMFFLRGIPTLAGLATVQLQQGIVVYLDIAFLGFYFASDILRRRFPRTIEAVRQVVGPEPLSPRPPSLEWRLDELAQAHGLSEREKEILAMAAQGFSYERIAAACFISKHTVKTHLSHLYQKLGVKGKAELAGRIAGITQ